MSALTLTWPTDPWLANRAVAQAIGSSASVTTTGFTSTSGSLLVVGVTCFGNHIGATPITDSKGNTWVAAIASTGVTQGWAALFYCENCTGGAGHTFTFTPSANDFIAIGVVEIPGAALSSSLNGTNSSTTNTSTHNSGTIASGGSLPEVWVGVMATSATAEGVYDVVSTLFTWQQLLATATTEGIVWGARLVAPSTTDAFKVNTQSSQVEAILLAGFKGASAGAGGTTPFGVGGFPSVVFPGGYARY